MPPLTFPLMAFLRHRLGIDGQGVTSLAAAWGCPLRCAFCLNRQCWQGSSGTNPVTVDALYDMAKADNLYFQATNGGVTFGGGEPLIYADFIRAFADRCGRRWRIMAETSLCVPADAVRTAAACVDEFLVDIKDMNPEIYRKYTGRGGDLALANLRALIETAGPDRITVRVPHIPGFNTDRDVESSVKALRDMGVTRIDVFSYVVRE